MDKAEEEKMIAEKLVVSMEKHRKEIEQQLFETEVLPDLHLPIRDVLGLLGSVQMSMDDKDFQMVAIVFAMMYGLEDEREFLKRLAKTAMVTLPIEDVEVIAKP